MKIQSISKIQTSNVMYDLEVEGNHNYTVTKNNLLVHNCTHGKDPSKSDFSYAIYSRYLAKNLVAAGVAPQVEIQLASAIGASTPVAIYVEAAFLDDDQCSQIATILQENLDMSCNAIIEQLHLLETNRTSTNFDYTFGLQPKKEEGLPLPYFHPWESLDLVPKFKELFKNI